MDYNYMNDMSGSSVEEPKENTKKCKKIFTYIQIISIHLI